MWSWKTFNDIISLYMIGNEIFEPKTRIGRINKFKSCIYLYASQGLWLEETTSTSRTRINKLDVSLALPWLTEA